MKRLALTLAFAFLACGDGTGPGPDLSLTGEWRCTNEIWGPGFGPGPDWTATLTERRRSVTGTASLFILDPISCTVEGTRSGTNFQAEMACELNGRPFPMLWVAEVRPDTLEGFMQAGAGVEVTMARDGSPTCAEL